jgi:decaprenylphospho-beta-D-ribofuranose 2-oxidase
MYLTGWGRYPRIESQGCYFEDRRRLRECLAQNQELIIHALGRSYGDSSLNRQVVFSRRFNSILDFQPQTGIVTCESGISLAELIEAFLPRGWFLATTPGTKFITVGGAVASDVHGKNHHCQGCFSQGVISFDLMLANGKVVRCSRTRQKDLFLATCGGMGLTGVILAVTLQLQRLGSAYIRETTMRAANLRESFELFEAHRQAPYSVAWIDCLAQGKNLGRSLLMLGEPLDDGRLELPRNRKSLSIPVELPGWCLNRYTIKLFNHLYYQRIPTAGQERTVHLEEFFYPLDSIAHWNRLYGPQGFTQYQLVLPKATSFQGLQEILTRISQAGVGSFLGVLKLFGPANDNYLSFPMEGYTLALDFKIHRQLFPLLDELDRVLIHHGGRLYLTKDVRMSPEVFRQGYPRWEKFLELREKMGLKDKFNSLQSKRLAV